jgi:hypothetical protein
MSTQIGEHRMPASIETIRILADVSIRRACGFALLAVSCIMFAFSFDLQQAFHVGAILVGMLAVVLWLKSVLAPRKPYFRTELWIMLPERPRMGKPELQRLISGILAERFWWHAQVAAVLAAGLGGIAILIGLARMV